MDQSSGIKYSVVEGWEQLPKGFVHKDVAGVAVDQEDRVYLICRGDHPIIIYDRDGNFKRSWGEGEFSYRTHGIYVAPNGNDEWSGNRPAHIQAGDRREAVRRELTPIPDGT